MWKTFSRSFLPTASANFAIRSSSGCLLPQCCIVGSRTVSSTLFVSPTELIKESFKEFPIKRRPPDSKKKSHLELRQEKIKHNEKRCVAKRQNIRISPKKLNLVARLIRGVNYFEAIGQLENSGKAIAPTVIEVLNTARYAGEHHKKLNPDRLLVGKLFLSWLLLFLVCSVGVKERERVCVCVCVA